MQDKKLEETSNRAIDYVENAISDLIAEIESLESEIERLEEENETLKEQLQ